MKEIERMIKKYQSNQIEFDGMEEWLEAYTKAIEQYVIKARIEELENICLNLYGATINYETFDKRIAQLKKGLEDKTN